MTRYSTTVLLAVGVLCISMAAANDLYVKVKVKDCKGPVKGADVEVSECVKNKVTVKTDEDGFAFFTSGIQYCSEYAYKKCVIKVVSDNGYKTETLKDKYGSEVSPRKYVCGLNDDYCGSAPDYKCETHKDITYDKVIRFTKDNCPKPPCIIEPYGKCDTPEGYNCMPGKHDEPGKPGMPGKYDPGTPDKHGKPGMPDKHDGPGKDGEPGKHDEPYKHGEPGMPEYGDKCMKTQKECKCAKGYECKFMKKADYAQCLPESYDDGPPHKPGPPFLPFSKDGDDKDMGHDKPMDPENGKGDKPMGPEKGMGHDKPMDPEKGMGDKPMGDKDGKFFGGKKPCVLGADQTCGSWWGPYPKCVCEEGYTCMKKGYGEYWKCKKDGETSCILKEGQTCGKNSPYEYPYKECKCEKGFHCLKTGYGDYKCQKKAPPPPPTNPPPPPSECVKDPWEKCGNKNGPYDNCKCTNGYTCKKKGDDVWKCEKKSNDPKDPEDPKDPKDPCVKQPWQICGDWHGKYEHCKCTDGYECKDQGYGLWKCKEKTWGRRRAMGL